VINNPICVFDVQDLVVFSDGRLIRLIESTYGSMFVILVVKCCSDVYVRSLKSIRRVTWWLCNVNAGTVKAIVTSISACWLHI